MRHAAGIPPRGARVRTLPSAMGELHKAAMRLMAKTAQPDGAATGSVPSPPPAWSKGPRRRSIATCCEWKCSGWKLTD